LSGWRTACDELGLPTERNLAFRCQEDTIDAGARATAVLLDTDPAIDAIVAISDILALGALRELTRRGLVAGVEVAVTGFDDSPLASVVSPALTSIRQPMDEIATELIDILTTSTPTGPTERLLQPELVVRGSSAPG
jgi:DNA-binding LacI/PurR family transcriptional regulator